MPDKDTKTTDELEKKLIEAVDPKVSGDEFKELLERAHEIKKFRRS